MSYRNPQERVEECIQRVMSEHPGESPTALARYFEAVHQELAPLARELERQRDAAWEESRAIRKAVNANPQEATSDEVERVVAQRDKLLEELKAAHQIIKNALNLMTMDQKTAWSALNLRDMVDGEGITRANERLEVISKVEARRA